MSNYLVLLRHGQSEWNVTGRFTGFADIDLTNQGREDAARAGDILRSSDIVFQKAFSSLSKRAQETAQIALGHAAQSALLKNMTVTGALRGRNEGDATGKTRPEAYQEYGEEQVKRWNQSVDEGPPGGETLRDVFTYRVDPYYQNKIKPRLERGENIFVSTHHNTIRALYPSLSDVSLTDVYSLRLDNGIPIVFEFRAGKPVGHRLLTNDAAMR